MKNFKKIIDSKRDEIIKEEIEKLNTEPLKEIEIDEEFEFLLFNEIVVNTNKFGIMENKLNTL